MNPRRGRSTLIANPVLVGAVTVMVTIVAVFLAYNANTGLPFVPTYQFKAAVPDAAELVEGNDVLIGGSRVGLVTKIEPVVRDGKPIAILELKIEEGSGPIPEDTRLLIRQRSNVGLKYVELRPGRSSRTLSQGQELALDRATRPVSLDESLDTFDAPTRAAVRSLLQGLGGGVAGRGESINRALDALPPVLADLTVVARVLTQPDTELSGFIHGAAAAAATVAPVADQLGDLFDSGAVTFAALARERQALAASIDAAATMETRGVPALRASLPLLREATLLARDARPGIRALPTAGRRVVRAIDRAAPVLGRAQQLAAPLGATIAELRSLARRPSTTGSLQRLAEAMRSLKPALEYINPMQVKCNYLALWLRNVPSLASEGDNMGTWFRFQPIVKLDEWLPSATKAPDLHYATQVDAGQNGECESGNESFLPGQHVGPIPGTQPGRTEATKPGSLAERVAAESDPAGGGR